MSLLLTGERVQVLQPCVLISHHPVRQWKEYIHLAVNLSIAAPQP